MRGVSEKLALVTRQAAVDMGVEVVDIGALSVDNNVCSSEPWVNGPVSKKGDGASFHPTLAGAKAVAQAIFKKISSS